MKQELGIMRQNLFPAERILGTLLSLGSKGEEESSARGATGSSRNGCARVPMPPLLDLETVDFLEEVQVGVKTVIMWIRITVLYLFLTLPLILAYNHTLNSMNALLSLPCDTAAWSSG